MTDYGPLSSNKYNSSAHDTIYSPKNWDYTNSIESIEDYAIQVALHDVSSSLVSANLTELGKKCS